MKKCLALLTMLVVLALAFTACRGDDTTPAATPEPVAEATPAPPPEDPAEDPAEDPPAETEGPAPVSIRAAWWGGTERNDLYNALIDAFVAEFPHVTVTREPIGWGDYFERLAIQVAGGNAPDFMGIGGGIDADYINRGILAPLDGFIADGVIDISGWPEETLAMGRGPSGSQYMLMMGVGSTSAFINEGLFNELGIDLPDLQWSWDDVRSIGLQFREAFDARGENRSWLMTNWIAAFSPFSHYAQGRTGQRAWTVDGQMNFDEQIVADWFNMFIEFTELGIVPDAATNVEFAGATLEDSLFAQSRLGVISYVPVNQFAAHVNTFPDKEMSIIRFPSVSAGGDLSTIGAGASWAIAANSPPENQLAAAQLLNFWLNTETGLNYFRLDQGIPANTNAMAAVMPHLTEPQQRIVEYVDMLFSIAQMPPPVVAPMGAAEVQSLFAFYAESAIFGLMSGDDAAAAFFEEAQDALARAQQ